MFDPAAEAFLREVNAPGEAEGQNRNEGQQCMARLNHAWRTEVNSPEILEFDADKADLIDKVRQSLKEQIELLGEMFADATDEQREQNHFTKTLYEMEIERVRYALARYLRARILKIEDALEFIIANPDMLNRLSDAENRFATRLQRLNNNHFEDQLSSKLPESCQNEPELLGEEFTQIFALIAGLRVASPPSPNRSLY